MTIENLQAICRQWPGVTEDVKWGHDLVFSVGGKMFCVAGLDQFPVTASFKVTDEQFDELSNAPGFKPAPYVAKYKWVWLDDTRKLKKKEWEEYLRQSYELVAAKLPAKTKKQIGIKS